VQTIIGRRANERLPHSTRKWIGDYSKNEPKSARKRGPDAIGPSFGATGGRGGWGSVSESSSVAESI
jgi:hypothetical protein